VNQLHGSAFGDNPLQPNNLEGITILFDRGYSFRQNLEDAVLSSGADVTCSTQRGGNIPFDYGADRKPDPSGKKTLIPEKGIQMVDLMKKTTAEGKPIVCLAYRTGTGKVVLGQSTKHITKTIDFISKTERGGKLWKEDREALKKEGFSIVQPASATLVEKRALHADYYSLFNALEVDQVTTESNDIFWHLGRKWSMSSKQVHDFVVVLKRHFCDIDSEDEEFRSALQRLLKFLYKGYNVDERRDEKTRQQQADEHAEAARNAAINGAAGVCQMSLDELIECEGPVDYDSIEQEVQWFIHLVESGETNEGDALRHIQSFDLSDGFLEEFNRQVGTIPGRTTMLKNCENWIKAPSDPEYSELVNGSEKKTKLLRRLILKKKDDIKVVYRQQLGKSPGSKKISIMIQELLRNADSPQVSAEREEIPSLKQEFINTIVGGISLKHLTGENAQDAAKGHEMESVYSADLQERYKYDETLDAIADIGLIKCKEKSYAKASIDRLLCVRSQDGRRDLIPCEFKARVKAATIAKENERIAKLARRTRIDGIIVPPIHAEHYQLSHLAIASPAERMQLLHQCYVIKKQVGVHAVGDKKRLLSCCKMTFSSGLFDAYAIVLAFIYQEALEIFYRQDPSFEGKIQANEAEMKMIKKAIEKHKDMVVDYDSLLYNHQLHFEAMRNENLPYPPLQMIIPKMLSDWNIMKPSGDQVTQMLWSLNYSVPYMNPQSSVVKRLSHLIPLYNIHRLFQLFSVGKSLQDFATIRSFRRYVNKQATFWDSAREVEGILIRMQQLYSPPPAINSVAHLRQMNVPAGCVPVAGFLPSTGVTPHHNPRAFYNNPLNAGHTAYDRRAHCVGVSIHFPCDESGSIIKRRHRCAACGNDRATAYCFGCHCWLHHTPSQSASNTNPLMTCTIDGKQMFAVQTCADKYHFEARMRAFENASMTRNVPQLTWVSRVPGCYTPEQTAITVNNSQYAQQPATSVTTLAANGHGNMAHPGTSSAAPPYAWNLIGQYAQQPAASVGQGNAAHPGRSSRAPRVSLEPEARARACKCKKSQCIKKYCECFAHNVKCGSKCRCRECKNKHTQSAIQGAPTDKTVVPLTLPSPLASSSSDEDDEDDSSQDNGSSQDSNEIDLNNQESNRKRRLSETTDSQSKRSNVPEACLPAALSNGRNNGCAAGVYCTAPNHADLSKSTHKCLHCQKAIHCALFCGQHFTETLKSTIDLTRFTAERRSVMEFAGDSNTICHLCINLAKKR